MVPVPNLDLEMKLPNRSKADGIENLAR
ncbi:hypothetical protein CCACVL1_04479 [Corchorus capsularis]|uniref:Uncharacterized protein n=1 Tax=Corchorus capsularis TaxID=210143 RepID=A0A1R3JSE7_COCAP|nr:hypothetical protein CCACVL1_04479 [Corchorus capsularis]